MGSRLVLPGTTGDTGSEGLTKPGSITECWAPSPERKKIDSQSSDSNGRVDVSSQEHTGKDGR